MAPISRRVSYIVPSPNEPAPYLQLPPLDQNRRGHTSPFFIPKHASTNGTSNLGTRNPFLSLDEDEPVNPNGTSTSGVNANGDGSTPYPTHPRHCLGVTSLALDTSTVLSNSTSPGGILYSGGRDGLVCSWELNVPHKRRRGGRYEILPGRGARTRWEKVGDGAEFFEEDEDEDEEGEGGGYGDDEDEFGDRGDSSDEEDTPGRGEVPYEDRWEVDKEAIAKTRPAETTYRQSAQTHTDWVNAVLLCNLNQTVITASSDRTIRAWSPHAASDEQGLSPSLIGTHRDYVRALAWAKYPGLLFSGSLDRRLNLWDVQGGLPDTPVMSINMDVIEDYGGVGMEGERGSVYALGVDHTGGILAAGTPERVIRLWDPRSGERSVGKLIGHSDCVRSILVSEDGRYMLTGSSDTTVKLWSLAAHRCIHTFAHHTSSVWSLFSNHPNLERFYSGSRDGHLCAIDVEQITDMADGECVVLSRDSATAAPVLGSGEYESKSGEEGIRAIVGMDDEYVWTANGSADIKRWRDVGRRVNRSTSTVDGASYGLGLGQGFVQQAQPPPAAAPAASLTQPLQTQVSPPEGIRNKRLSLDGGDDLVRVESRESRSVAFAPEPIRNGEQGSPNLGSGGAAVAGLPVSPSRDRLGVPGGVRRTTMSGAPVAGSIATSILSENSSMPDHDHEHDLGDGIVSSADLARLNEIPYASLVSLGIADSPYSFGFGEANRAASIHSGRGGASFLVPESGSPRKGSAQIDGPIHVHPGRAAELARYEYEERDIASEAKPLRSKPDGIIAGRPGLVRSLVLNDRQHVLTVDTEGEVSAWNILSGKCIGRFSAAEIAAALDLERGIEAGAAVRKHSSEVLELVKQRVEGETMVITWCAVDTKIGSLVVHLEEGRVFDAEVYADELGVEVEGAGPDARINLGKWALANLFKGLIQAEERELTSSPGSSAQSASVTNPPSLSRSPASLHISIERPSSLSPPHRQRALSNLSVTSSLNILGIASPAATPAILPDVPASYGYGDGTNLHQSRSAPTPGFQSFNALRSGPLSAIPQSPTVNSNNANNANAGALVPPGTGGSAATSPAPEGSGGRGDYFSIRKRVESSPNREASTGAGAATPGATSVGESKSLKEGVSGNGDKRDKDHANKNGGGAELSSSAPSSTPGLMGKLKGFGKKKEKETPMSVVVEDEVVKEDEPQGPQIPEREAAQLAILDTVRSHPFRPPPPWEAPALDVPQNTSLLISEESKDAGAWVVTYRSHVNSTGNDLERVEGNAPLWLLDYLFTSRTRVKEPVKLTFILEPVPGCGLGSMPDGTARLSASRILRARKVLAFIYDKLELGTVAAARNRQGSVVSINSRITAIPRKASGGGGSSAVPIPGAQQGQQGHAHGQGQGGSEGVEPEDLIELVCGDTVVDPYITLATLKQYYGSGGDMLLMYRPKKTAM